MAPRRSSRSGRATRHGTPHFTRWGTTATRSRAAQRSAPPTRLTRIPTTPAAGRARPPRRSERWSVDERDRTAVAPAQAAAPRADADGRRDRARSLHRGRRRPGRRPVAEARRAYSRRRGARGAHAPLASVGVGGVHLHHLSHRPPGLAGNRLDGRQAARLPPDRRLGAEPAADARARIPPARPAAP